MSKVAKGITRHSIVLCMGKMDRSLPVETLLKKNGFKVFNTQNPNDALRNIMQEMPHLVISDSVLPGGHAGNLYDRALENPITKDVPILVLVADKSKEQLTPLKGRKFAGFLLGRLETKSLTAKIDEILNNYHDCSPYLATNESYDFEESMTVAMAAKCIGVSDEQVIFQSESEVDANASLVCLPDDSERAPAILKKGSNVVKEESVFNLFPLSRIRGKGRKWLTDLPEINLDGGGDGEGEKTHKVLFFDPAVKRFDQFKTVLAGYNIELIHAPSIQVATTMIQRGGNELSSVYLHELTSDASSLTFKDTLNKISENERPPIIVGTSSMNMRSTAELRYIKKPFGLGVLVEMMEAAFKSKANIANAINESPSSTSIGCKFQAPAKLIGLDETGGVIQLKFPLVKGSSITLEHPLLETIWEGETTVKVSGVGSLENKADVWHVKFDSLKSSGSKGKYWERVYKNLSEIAKDSGEAAEAEEPTEEEGEDLQSA